MRKGLVILLCVFIMFGLFGCTEKSVGESTDESVVESCKHRFTKVEEVNPTCNSEGFKKLVCDLCGKENTISTPKWEHLFGQPEVTKAPTCSSAGEQQEVCKLCGFSKTSVVSKINHNYVDKVCSMCGYRKPVQKSELEPNTWYTYQGGPLQIQNCLVATAILMGQGRTMTVQYRSVCQYCHAVENLSNLAGPEINYPVNKNYYCDECGKQTIVRFKIG